MLPLLLLLPLPLPLLPLLLLLLPLLPLLLLLLLRLILSATGFGGSRRWYCRSCSIYWYLTSSRAEQGQEEREEKKEEKGRSKNCIFLGYQPPTLFIYLSIFLFFICDLISEPPKTAYLFGSFLNNKDMT